MSSIDYISLFTLLGVALAVLVIVAVWTMSTMLIRPPRMNDGKAALILKRLSPSDLGLKFETKSFDVRDENGRLLKIVSWWMPKESSRATVVLIHGYADAKVGALAWAPMLHHLGLNILALDLRAHGESEGVNCTGGVREREDVAQVIDRLRLDHPDETQKLILFGISLGGAVAVGVGALRDDIDAIVCDSLYTSFDRAARVHGERIAAPARCLHFLAIRIAASRAGVDFSSVNPIDLISLIRCPVFLVFGEDDAFVSQIDRNALKQLLFARNNPNDRSWTADRADHVLALAVEPDEYEHELREFLRRSGIGLSNCPDQSSRRITNVCVSGSSAPTS